MNTNIINANMPIIVALVILVLLVIFLYNNLVAKRNRVEQSLSGIDTFLQKRFDLMSNLFIEAERVLDHESEVYKAISMERTGFNQIRQAYETDKTSTTGVVKADVAMGHFLSGARSTFEQYPELRALKAMDTVMAQNISIENEINASRRQYNSNVTVFRNAIQSFPNNVFAGIFGFTNTYELYKADDITRGNVKPVYSDYYSAKYEQKTKEIRDGK